MIAAVFPPGPDCITVFMCHAEGNWKTQIGRHFGSLLF
jgi:hypothetical protein